jgi:hypothetical protein
MLPLSTDIENATPEDLGTCKALYRMTAHRWIVMFYGRPLRYQAGQPKHFRAGPPYHQSVWTG